MDPAASEAVVAAADSGLNKQPKVRKAVKDLTPDERKKESEKRAGRRVAMRNRQNAARLDEERWTETEWFLAVHALANSEELARKATARAFMMMKQETINVAFGGIASMPPSCGVGGALSTSSVTSTPSGRPPALELNKHVSHAPAQGNAMPRRAMSSTLMARGEPPRACQVLSASAGLQDTRLPRPTSPGRPAPWRSKKPSRSS
jgi:hypothetical protein